MALTVGAEVGQRVRSTRRDRGLTISALAAAAHIGKGSLSEIEQGVRNPTLGTLYALAGALGVPLSWLLAQRIGAEASSDALTSRLLDIDENDRGTIEVYAIVLAPLLVHRSEPHGPSVLEHLLVTRGRIAAGPLGEERLCAEGESTMWVADGVHTYRSIGADPARAILTMRWDARTAGVEPVPPGSTR